MLLPRLGFTRHPPAPPRQLRYGYAKGGLQGFEIFLLFNDINGLAILFDLFLVEGKGAMISTG
jgi:hypothetical protein